MIIPVVSYIMHCPRSQLFSVSVSILFMIRVSIFRIDQSAIIRKESTYRIRLTRVIPRLAFGITLVVARIFLRFSALGDSLPRFEGTHLRCQRVLRYVSNRVENTKTLPGTVPSSGSLISSSDSTSSAFAASSTFKTTSSCESMPI